MRAPPKKNFRKCRQKCVLWRNFTSRDESRSKGAKDCYPSDKRGERNRSREKKQSEERDGRSYEKEEFIEHQKKMSKLEASLHELYPTSKITRQECQDEEPFASVKKRSNDDMPMEKFQTDSVSQLSESELLAIIMGNSNDYIREFRELYQKTTFS